MPGHFFYETQVKTLCQKSLFHVTPVEGFAFVREYHDASYTVLTTNAAWCQAYLDHAEKMLPHVRCHQRFTHIPAVILLDDRDRLPSILHIDDIFNVHQVMILFFRYRKYNEYFIFFNYSNRSDALRHYFQEIGFYQQFTLFFKQEMMDAIHRAHRSQKERMKLPQEKLGFFYEMFPLPMDLLSSLNIKKFFVSDESDVFLTPKEFACCIAMIFGENYADIASHSKISPRTVEKHFEHVRAKLKVKTRSQIIQLLFQHNFYLHCFNRDGYPLIDK